MSTIFYTGCTKEYFSRLKTNKEKVNVYVTNGAMLTGIIVDYDDISLLLNSEECLVFYSNIISVKKTPTRG